MWQWFDGKKTIIGTICLYVAELIIGGLIKDQLHFSPEWLTTIQTILTWIGGILVPGGLGHKYIKANTIPK